MKFYFLLFALCACGPAENRNEWFGRVNHAIQVGVDAFVAPERDMQQHAFIRCLRELGIGLLRFALTIPAAIMWAASRCPPPRAPAQLGATRNALEWIADNVIQPVVPEWVDERILEFTDDYDIVPPGPIGGDPDTFDWEIIDHEEIPDDEWELINDDDSDDWEVVGFDNDEMLYGLYEAGVFNI